MHSKHSASIYSGLNRNSSAKVNGKRVIGAADRSALGSRLTFQGWQTPGAWLYDAWWTRLDRETGGVP